ncbi:MAG: hypothetical protein IPI50_08190 [Saprospiraceae bacterium]|nr:hypothetical protein [Saprospiraceae bacterium]
MKEKSGSLDFQDRMELANKYYPNSPNPSAQVPKKLLDSVHYSNPDETMTDYILLERYFYYYDKFGINHTEIRLSLDEVNKTWEKSDSIAHERKGNGDIVTSTYFKWNSGLNRFEGYFRYTNTYDANNNLILYQDYEWVDQKWLDDTKIESFYDPQNNNIRNIASSWNESLNIWEYDSKEEFIYNLDNEISEFHRFVWDDVTSEFVLRSKYYYEYDQMEFLVERIEYRLNRNTKEFELYGKILFQNNSHGQVLIQTYQSYDKSLGEFTNFLRYRDSYDQDQDLEYSYLDFWSSEMFKNANRYKYHYSIHDLTSDAADVTYQKHLSISPVPAYDRIMINTTNDHQLNAFVKDINGNQVFIAKIENGIYSVQDLVPGVYFIRTEDSRWTRFIKIE